MSVSDDGRDPTSGLAENNAPQLAVRTDDQKGKKDPQNKRKAKRKKRLDRPGRADDKSPYRSRKSKEHNREDQREGQRRQDYDQTNEGQRRADKEDQSRQRNPNRDDASNTRRDASSASDHKNRSRNRNRDDKDFRPRETKGPRFAALDLGTNNCRLLVAETEGRGFRVVDAFSRIIRLGDGLSKSGALSEAAMDRATEALAVCSKKLRDNNVRHVRLIATEACRVAENGEGFLQRVKQETGLTLEVVDRETEARLAVAGCSNLIDKDADGVVVFDIGGGSSEIIWVDLKGRFPTHKNVRQSIRSWTSLPVGVVSLSDSFGGVKVDRDIYEKMVDHVAAMLDDFPEAEALSEAIASQRVHFLGTSGTITTLAGVHLGLKRYDRRKVDGTWLNRDQINAMIGEVLDMPFETRAKHPCIGPDRADLVLGGCAILDAISRRWPCERMRVADRGLREGILAELMARDRQMRYRRSQNRKRHTQ